MSKRAFLVGINEFTRADWALRGCVNDTLAMRQLLGENFNFANDQIRVLHNQDATTKNIRDGLAWLFSDYQGGGQDVRLFHFASHGTQVRAYGQAAHEFGLVVGGDGLGVGIGVHGCSPDRVG
jgi:hypothetical protein